METLKNVENINYSSQITQFVDFEFIFIFSLYIYILLILFFSNLLEMKHSIKNQIL